MTSPGSPVRPRLCWLGEIRGYAISLAAILVSGALLRLLPIRYGLPFSYHPDETWIIFNIGKFLEGMARGNVSIDTSTFYYPLAVIYGAYFISGRITGHFSSVSDFKQVFLLDDPNLHLLGRGMAASFSVATLLLTYALGKRVYGQRAGIIASLLMATSLIDVSSSHWVKLDSTVTFMSVLSVLAMLRLTDQKGLRASWVAGFSVGLAMATRIDSFVLLPLLVFAHFLQPEVKAHSSGWQDLFSRELFASLGAALVTYLLVSFRLAGFLFRDVLGNTPMFKTREMAASISQFLMAGDVSVSVRHNLWFYLSDVLIGTLGIILTGLVLLGLIRATVSRGREELIIIGFLALSLLSLLTFNVYGTHYFLRLVPFLMIMAGGAILTVSNWMGNKSSLRWTALLVALALAQPAYFSVNYVTYLLKNVDTRTRAREWIYQHIPFGERIAVQKIYELPRYVPALNETRDQVEKKLAIVRSDGRSSGLAFEAKLAHYPEDRYEIVNLSDERHWSAPGASLENSYDYERLIAERVRYAVTSGWSSPSTIDRDGSPMGILISPRFIDHEALERYQAFMRRLHERGRLVAEFGPRNRKVARRTDSPIDPTIRVYRLE